MKFTKNVIPMTIVGAVIFMSPAIVGFGVGIICRLICMGWHFAWISP